MATSCRRLLVAWGGSWFLPLDSAVTTYLWYRENFPWTDSDDLPPGWFPVATYGNGDAIWVDCGVQPADPAPLIYRYSADYNYPDELARRTVPSVARGVEVWAALLERGIWRVVGPGDTVSLGGVTMVLDDRTTRSYDFVRDRDDDLPAAWP